MRQCQPWQDIAFPPGTAQIVPRRLRPVVTINGSSAGVEIPAGGSQFREHARFAEAVVDGPEIRQGFLVEFDALHQWRGGRSEEHTAELQSLRHLGCRLLLYKTA